ncbi:glycosyltransferase family 2 protein [Commensalibacter nepenthis]|uniref:Glycosyltransferase family 2 protein n=1 Tax=Commensalibacter nepenthis TaxID=3043872 RepID=A0ABT6Q944_9PROT|nr:glycosyltransferase family 2 protein [Commensalibacter sp. TBRC 10068]MDI2113428.1 glycosyltransferase family 2 protein [Commensalibacter sp. TBRC 10068]
MVDIRNIIKERELLLYSHIPVGVFRNSGEWPEPEHQHSLFLYTNDTSERIIEWITYHHRIGFSHFYIYSYHDDPTYFYQQLLPFLNSGSPLVTYYHYADPGNAHQAFCHFFRNHGNETKWILWLNIDEFLCLKTADTIREFSPSDHQEIDVVYFNLCHYGHSYFESAPEGDILLNYTFRANKLASLTRVMIQTQSLPYGKLFHHFSTDFQYSYEYLDAELNSINVLGDDLSLYFTDYPLNAESYLNQKDHHSKIIDTAYIAHFGLPSIMFIENQNNNEQFTYYGGQTYSIPYQAEDMIQYFDQFNEVEDSFLYELWIEQIVTAWNHSVFPVNFWHLLSSNKPSIQSSTAHECSVEDDAKKLVNGLLLGTAQNLTKIEDNPWWQIDLKEIFLIHEIQLFNRLDQNIQASCLFEIFSSTNGHIWQCIARKTNPELFGGMDGTPYVWTSEKGVSGRFIKLVIPGNNKQIGLDQIQIFGKTLQN